MDAPGLAEELARIPPDARKAALAELSDKQVETLRWSWRFWARPSQLPPEGNWATWVMRGGRGSGKTRTGSGWIQERATEHPGRQIAMIARTPADARDYMIEGPGGILKNTPPLVRPVYEPSKRRLTWPNGSRATIYSDGEPDQLRGFSGDTAWLDEFAKFRSPKEVWDNLQFGMREASGDKPRRLITTTPRPLGLLRDIERMPSTVVIVGSSYDNRANLDPSWFEETIQAYEGTRLGRQEIHAEILEDVPGALWSQRSLDDHRAAQAPELKRIVVGVDPSIAGSENANETGIVGMGTAEVDGSGSHGYVLDDRSLQGSPEEWGRAAVACYRGLQADLIVAERNQGGEMVEHVIRSVDPNVPVKLVTASRGKFVRAEPISSLYEQGRIHHVGVFATLEDQMIAFTPETAANRRHESPDRVDALVWAASELFESMVSRRKSDRALPRRQNSRYSPQRWRWS
jgi:phage terminase large subunit-like protein